jgi:ATP-dependent Clp protease adaptor protein ClpS
MDIQGTPISMPTQSTSKKNRPAKNRRRQPRYHVILLDDSYHSYDYVVLMMKQLFRLPIETGYKIATEVDQAGRAICLTTSLEHAELKRDQIHAFGKDELVAQCKGSMSALIEPVAE